jgi:glycosyltransferase involved in cell wall biosynthesis
MAIGNPDRGRSFHTVIRQFVPLTWRHRLKEAVAGFNVPSAAVLAPGGSTRNITLLGHLTGPTGLGEGARLAADALADAGYTVGLIDVTHERDRAACGEPRQTRPQFVEGDIGGPLVVHLNPPDFQIVLSSHRLSGRNRKLIAYWAWEASAVPSHWRRAFRLAHEIWVPSRFVAEVLRSAGCTVPLRVVHHPVRGVAAGGHQRAAPSTLRVLTVFAYDSGFDRKNPLAAVAAFRSAFGQRTDVQLVIKARGRSVSGIPERRLAAAVAGMPNVTMLKGTHSRAEYLDLLRDCDVLLSLHRAEGFGLVMAEAMLMGKPVVATAWSGNLDFMTDRSACLVPARLVRVSDENYRAVRANWAEPSVDVAAAWLTQLTDPALRQLIGEAAQAHAERQLGPAAFIRSITGQGDDAGSSL